MAIGPVKFAGIIGGRTIAPTVYANPLGESSLAGWVANPANDWVWTSVIVVIFMMASSLWLFHGVVSFAKTNALSFAIALIILLIAATLLVEGGKYNPWHPDQTMFAAMIGIALLSSAGRLFAQKDDKEDLGKDKK